MPSDVTPLYSQGLDEVKLEGAEDLDGQGLAPHAPPRDL
jgi:hypothetical protein